MRHSGSIFILAITFACCLFGFSTQTQAAGKPTLKNNDLLCNGESFFAASNICKELSRFAREDGVLASGDFKEVAQSGVPISTVMSNFKNANPKPKFVVTDGGGIDLMNNTCKAGDVNCPKILEMKKTLIAYIGEMKKAGVKAFVWMAYPDPVKSYAGALKTGQDIWSIVAKQVIDTITEPKPLWVDLRETWKGHYDQYTGDGIHCTDAGGTATAKAFWDSMKANNYAFFDTIGTSVPNSSISGKTAPSHVSSQIIGNKNLSVSLTTDQPSSITLKLTTVSGRCIYTSQRHTSVSGKQTLMFPVGTLASGIYCCEVNAGKVTNQSTLFVP